MSRSCRSPSSTFRSTYTQEHFDDMESYRTFATQITPTSPLRRQDTQDSLSDSVSSIFDSTSTRSSSPNPYSDDDVSDVELMITPVKKQSPPPPKASPWAWRFAQLVSALAILFVSCGLWANQPAPQPPIGSIARAALLHTSLSRDLVSEISKLQASCSEDKLPEQHITTLMNLIRPFDPATTEKLRQASLATSDLRKDLFQPSKTVYVHFDMFGHVLAHMEQLLTTIQFSPKRLQKSESTLEYYADSRFVSDIPVVLNELLLSFNVAIERCDSVLVARQSLLSGLEGLMGPLGLVKPWFVRRKTWDSNPDVTARLHIIRSVLETFQQVEILREAFLKSKSSVLAYQKTPFIFGRVKDMPALNQISTATMDYYTTRLREAVPELKEVIQQVIAKDFA